MRDVAHFWGMFATKQRSRDLMASFAAFGNAQILDGNYVQGIGHCYRIILAHDHDSVCADDNKFWVRHAQALATGEFEHKGLEAIVKALADAIQIHTV